MLFRALDDVRKWLGLYADDAAATRYVRTLRIERERIFDRAQEAK